MSIFAYRITDMKHVFYLSLALLSVLLTQCTNSGRRPLSLDDTEVDLTDKKTLFFNGQVAYDSLMQLIDTSSKFTEFYSLEYSDGLQNNRTARGKFNGKKSIVKLELEETYVKGMQINTVYYFNGAFMFFAKQRIKDFNKKNKGFMEVFSYFGDKKKVIFSGSKMADSEEELELKNPVICRKTDFSAKEALDIVNQRGPYATRFQGGMETETLKFIIVGTKSKTPSYQSAIAYNRDFPLAEMLVKNEKDNLNKLLRIDFTRVTEQNGFSYQGLTGIKLINE